MREKELWNTSAEEWLVLERARAHCLWCGTRESRLNRMRLCSACNRTRLHELKVRRETLGLSATSTAHERWKQHWELRIAETMIDLCKRDGCAIEDILSGETFDVVSFERALSRMAHAFCHVRDFYHGIATPLAPTLGPAQRRLVVYLIWLPLLADHKRRRMKMAMREINQRDARRDDSQESDA